ncbi:unnamed protein product [Thelazia callipaeda]|uniref:TROVE domain-containing protein n=1 Tax=Thelazia callipaeda TaxID=103827 RepID=A0A0N5CJ44_THECL|nr:unnamed protein product [Thelazia callipaeda]
MDMLADDCAQKIFKAKLLGRNWKEIGQNLNLGVKKTKTDVSSAYFLKSVLIKSNNKSKLPEERVNILIPIFNSILFTTADDLSDAINEFRSTSIMPIFVDALGLVGTKTAYIVGKKAFTSVESEFLDRFLQALSQTTRIDFEIISDLKIWMKNTNDEHVKKQIGFTVANLYRRYCESSKSLKNACDNGKNNDVNEFTDYVSAQCNDKIDNSHCHINALQIFRNLPLPTLLPYASQFLCGAKNTKLLQKEALRFLQALDGKHLHWKTIHKLLRIFRNTCSFSQTVTDQTLAIEILLNALPHTEMIGTYLLRMEELFPTEQEKWTYFYSNVARRRQMSSTFNAYWTKMRSFRVFRPNYAHRSLNGTSDVSVINIEGKRCMIIKKKYFPYIKYLP